MRKTAIISIMITILVAFGSVYITKSCEPGEPFLKGSGSFIHGIRVYQHNISGDDFKDFDEKW